MRTLAVALAMLSLFCGFGCGGSKTSTVPQPPPAEAPTATLTASPSTITVSQSTTLSWTTTNATDVTIDGIGSVATSGSQAVVPAATAVYHLTATGPGGTQQATALVTVNQPAPPPTQIACWGDSLTQGNEDHTGVTYPGVLAQLTGLNVYNGGVGGETSTQIAGRMLSDTSKYGDITIIWAGRNNKEYPAQVLADIASMVAVLDQPRNFLVLSVLNGATDGPPGDTANNDILAINNGLAAAYPSNYLDIRSLLVAAYDPTNPQDVIDHANDVPPSSLRFDSIHLNSAGYTFVANRVDAALKANSYIAP